MVDLGGSRRTAAVVAALGLVGGLVVVGPFDGAAAGPVEPTVNVGPDPSDVADGYHHFLVSVTDGTASGSVADGAGTDDAPTAPAAATGGGDGDPVVIPAGAERRLDAGHEVPGDGGELYVDASGNVRLDTSGAGAVSPAAPDPVEPAAVEPAEATATGAAREPVLDHLREHPDVATVELVDDTYAKVRTTLDAAGLEALPGVATVDDDSLLAAWGTGADPDVATHQYWHTNTGQVVGGWVGSDGADLRVPDAWPRARGAGVTVAVIDSGVDVGHPDLRDRIWRNPGEVCGNGRDDDRNGFVDDCTGWDYVNRDSSVIDPAPADASHGTHIAGIVAATADNATGGAGIAPAAQIMPLKVGNGKSIYTSYGAMAIDYAVAHGARVVNLSWGSVPGSASTSAHAVLEAAIGRARDAGVLVVVAAGNSAVDLDTTPSWPASFHLANQLNVGATTNADRRASFSNVGRDTVDVWGPGWWMWSTMPGGGHGFMSGTSMAAPAVAAVAALVWSADPDASMADVRDRVLHSAVPLPALAGLSRTDARVDAGAALGDLATSVAVSYEGLGTVAAGTPHRTAARVQLLDPGVVPAGADVAVRATLAHRVESQLYGVVEHPLGPATTDGTGRALVVPAAPLAEHRTLRTAEGLAVDLSTELPAGDYALLVELVDGDDPDVVYGHGGVAYFGVDGPPAPAPAPGDGDGTTPTTAPADGGTPSPTTAPPGRSSTPPTTAPPSGGTTPTTAAPGRGSTSPTTAPGGATTPTTAPGGGTPPSPSPGDGAVRPRPTGPPTSPTTAPGGGGGGPTPTTAPPATTTTTSPTPPTTTRTAHFGLSVVTPSSGPTSGGGASLTLRGTAIPRRSTISIGGVTARVSSDLAPTMVLFTAPARPAGTYDVVVTGPDGSRDVLRGAYTYVDEGTPPRPAVTTTTTAVAGPPPGGGSTPTTAPSGGGATTTTVASGGPSTPAPGAPRPAVTTAPNGLKVAPLHAASRLRGLPATWTATTCSAASCAGIVV